MDLDVAEQEFSPRKLAALALVALLHVAIFYAFVTGLGEQAVQVLRAPLEAKIIQEVKPPPVIAQVTTVKPVTPPPTPRPAPPAVKTAPSLDTGQSCAPPQYPEDAQDMGQTGTSVLQFLIDTSGNVVSSRVAISSGHASLDNAAEQALGQCKFRPAIAADGSRQEAWTSIRYVWTLN
jgi:protein TonB